ncbi:MAG TPA: sulfatase-like hydrolase/transferase [Candidatus Limnocylindria bacterium]|nr:sulfatase-like hydrolase/transferase [Candidatus Limnocylindria bacterium]
MATATDVKNAKGSLLARAWWLHPFLLSAFPVVFLFASNIGEQVSLEPLGPPLAVALIVAAVGLLIAVTAARLGGFSPGRAALVLSLLVVLFFSYGHAWAIVGPTLGLHRFLLAAWGLVAILGTWLIAGATRRQVSAATGFLNVVGLVLVALNLVPIGRFAMTSEPTIGTAIPSSTQALSDPAHGTPDIWYLVFDRYAGADGLSATYDFDNEPFLAELERRGFQVVDHATANYLKTALSLTSTLNMDYLDSDALGQAASTPDDWSPVYRELQGSTAVERFVHDRGYEYVHLGLRRGATYTNSEADRVYVYGDQSEFAAVLENTTLLAALERVETSEPTGLAGLYGHQSLFQLGVLRQLAQSDAERPRFVFAHILLPHPPYVFNEDGSWVTDAQRRERSADEQYLEQLRFANARILELLDALDSRPAAQRPIVLIQADEGPFPDRYQRDEEGFRWTDATDRELLRKFSILAAYRLPAEVPDGLELWERITPVNSFRAIFNAAFDAGFEYLDDRNLVFVDQGHLYDEADVTDRLRSLP